MRALPGALALASLLLVPGLAGAGPPCECGNNVTCGLEICDDGNTASGDGCSFPSCLPEVCGDHIVNPDPGVAEECDDGNTVDDDGCMFPGCQFDCGDGEIDPTTTPPETCDDGNATNGDGCDDDPSATSPGNCTVTACGNGVITTPETCEPPNTATCDANCILIDVTPPDKGQQGCINAVNKNLAGVIKAQAADNATCVKDVSGGKTPALADCLGQDVKGKVAKAAEKTTKTITGKKCLAPNVPPFAFTDAATVNGTTSEVQDAFAVVFGAAPTIALEADKAGSGCQAEVLKQLNALTSAYIGEANKAKKGGLKGGKGGNPPPAGGPTALATAIDMAIATSAKITKAEGKANDGINKKCTTITGLFDCNAAADTNALTLCVIAAGKQAACEALETGDALDLSCPDATP